MVRDAVLGVIMKCKKNYKFVIVDAGKDKYIELRTKDNQYHQSICCKKCYKDLKKVMKLYESEIKKGD
jgi:hypothetical protein